MTTIHKTETEQLIPTEIADRLKKWVLNNPIHQITLITSTETESMSKVKISMPVGRNLFNQKLVHFLCAALTS
jgi:hypothetical protein